MIIFINFVKSDTFTSPYKSVMLYFAERAREHKYPSVRAFLRCQHACLCSYRIDGRFGDIRCADRHWAGDIIGPRKHSEAKAMPYELGMNPYGEGARRMPVRFYLIAVLFILFDIEVVFFLPWAIVFRQLGLFGLGRDDRLYRYLTGRVYICVEERST